MERSGVIIHQEEPTAWVISMATVLKPNGKLRICREHYQLKTIEDVVQQITQV